MIPQNLTKAIVATVAIWVNGHASCQITTSPVGHGHPTYCTENAKTDQSLVFPNEVVAALSNEINKKAEQVKQTLEISPPTYSTDGWAQDLIKKVEARIKEILNEVKDAVIRELNKAAQAAIAEIQGELAKITPNIRYSGQYTYEKRNRTEGSWSGLGKSPIGPHTLMVKGGAGFKLDGTVGLGVEVTIPTELKGTLTGPAKLTTPNSVFTYAPRNKPSLKVSTEPVVDVTSSFEVEVKAGFTLVGGGSITVGIPIGDVQATLNAGSGQLLYPERKTETYNPVCE